MILSTHALVGAAIGNSLDNAWAIIILALLLHYSMDTFRHGEYLDRRTKFQDMVWRVSLDIGIGLGIIILFIFYQNPAPDKIFLIYLGTFFSMLPDLFTVLFWKFKLKMLERFYRFHIWIHNCLPFAKSREWNLRNAANDIIFSLLAIAFLLL